jgi:hypothetical protein
MNAFNEKKLPIVTEESEHQMTLCQKIAKHHFFKITETTMADYFINIVFIKPNLTKLT